MFLVQNVIYARIKYVYKVLKCIHKLQFSCKVQFKDGRLLSIQLNLLAYKRH